ASRRRAVPAARPASRPTTRAPARASSTAASRLRERVGVGRPARQPQPDQVALRQWHVGTAFEADPALCLPCDRPVVGVVQGADRLQVRREVALRVVGAPPEDVAGPAGATRDQMAVVVLRARHLERERLGWRRALLLDVGAVRIARAADERAEPAALRDERPLPALRADLALAG